MDAPNEIKAFAPATVANLGPGFDVLGLALEAPGDTVVARRIPEREVRIAVITGDDGALSRDVRHNTAGMAALAAWQAAAPGFGIELEIHKGMPLGSGMGSSAASAAAAVVAAARLLGDPFGESDLLSFAAEGERVASGSATHYDNIAAALFGGFIRVRDDASAEIERIAPLPAWHVALVHPDIIVRTSEARAAIPPQVLASAVRLLAPRTDALVAAITANDLARAGEALMSDDVITPYRSARIAGYADIIDAALDVGAAGACISGSGPALFALAKDATVAERVAHAMREEFGVQRVNSKAYLSIFGAAGARVI